MSNKLIEARLERSLRNQVKAPRLAKRFDAAVWARIEAQSVRAPAPVKGSRVMFVFNAIGIGVACVLLAVFGLQSLSGVEAGVTLPAVAVPAGTMDFAITIGAQVLTFVPIAVGLMLTPFGRRVRQELRALL